MTTQSTVERMVKCADVLDKTSPLAAYHCRMHAVTLGQELYAASKEPALMNYLLEQLDKLEAAKVGLGDAAKDVPKAVQELYKVGCQFFAVAQKELDAGQASARTAALFLRAHIVLSVYATLKKDEISEQEASQIQYAKVQAASISAALKRGEVPSPGGLPAPSAPAENASLPDVPQPSFPAPAPSVPSVPPQQLISPTSHLNRDVSNLTGSQRSSQGGSPMSTTSAPAGQLSHSQPSNPPPANIPMNAPVVLSQSLPAPVAYNAATSTYRPPNTGLSPDEFAQALQQARYLLSALQFEDALTATKHARQCLQILTRGDSS